MASSGDDLEEEIHGQDGSGKKSGKKFLHPFRKMRRFFSSRRRAKSREDDVEDIPPGGTVKSKSTTDVLRAAHDDDDDPDDESGQFVSNKTLSMSADSVFTPDPRTKDTSLEGLQSSARSMEHLGQPPFTNELFQKLKSRRNEDDEGLPSSPVTQSTADVLNDFKKPIDKRHDSKHSVDSSMYSSEDELEEKNVFEQEWGSTVHSSRQNISAMTDSQEALDLNAVTSTTSLVSHLAKHKISVKPKGIRPSTRHTRPVKSPKTLPQLEEKEESKGEEKNRSSGSLRPDAISEKKDSPRVEMKEWTSSEDNLSSVDDSLHEESEEGKVEIQVTADVESPVDRKRQSDSSRDTDEEDEVVDENEEKPDEKAKPVDHPVTIIIPKSEPRTSPRTSPVPPPKSPKPQKKDNDVKRKSAEITKEPQKSSEEAEPERSPAMEEAGDKKPFGQVKLRKTGRRTQIEELGTIRLRENVGDRDPSKRQTIAGDAGLTIFGDRKASNRNSFVEASRSPEPKEESGESEFSQVLNRLKKQPSRKKLIPGEDESEKSASIERTQSQASKEKPVVVKSNSKVSETTVKSVDSKPKALGSTPQKVSDNKPKVPEGKPKIADNKPKISDNKPKISDNKPKISEVKPKAVHQGPSETKTEEVKPVETVSVSKPAEVPKSKEKEVMVIVKKEPVIVKKETVIVKKEPVIVKKEPVIVKKEPVPVKKESIIIKKEPVKPKEPEVKSTAPVVTASSSASKSEAVTEKRSSQTESKPTTPKTPTPKSSTPAKSDSSKTVVIEKAKPAEPQKPEVEKIEPKTPVKEEVKLEEKAPLKKDSPLVKNRVRSQTLTDQPVVQGANKENEKAIQRSNSQPDAVDDKPTPTANPADKAAKPSGQTPPARTAEPAWFTLARRKTANWDQKEKDLEVKEKKETSNIAEKERDASTKGKEVTLTIDEAAKEESKPALRTAVKCSNSAANRQSKVLDMAKLFQNQVS